MPRGLQLAQVLAHQPGHLEHGDFILSEDGLELGVRQDVSLVLRVLQVVGLDVLLHELHNFGAWLRRCTDHSGQLGAGSEGTVECGVLLGSGHLRLETDRCHLGEANLAKLHLFAAPVTRSSWRGGAAVRQELRGRAAQPLFAVQHDGELAVCFGQTCLQFDQVPVFHALRHCVARKAAEAIARRHHALDRFGAAKFEADAHLV